MHILTCKKCGACKAHTNPILDNGMYSLEFAGCEVIASTSNIIAESMYDQCDADGNKYLLFDLLVDLSYR